MEGDIQVVTVQARIMSDVPFDDLLLFGMDSDKHPGFAENTFQATFLSTNILPVEEPRKSFRPGTQGYDPVYGFHPYCRSSPPKKKE